MRAVRVDVFMGIASYDATVRSWTNATPLRTPGGAILHPGRLERRAHRVLADPDGAVSSIVERYWALRWEGNVDLLSSLLPTFSINLTWEVGSGREGTEGRAVVTGVPTRRFDVHLRGTGSVIGVKLHPCIGAAVCGVRASALTDRTLAAAEILPARVVDGFVEAVHLPTQEQVDALDGALAPLVPVRIPAGCETAQEALRRAHDPEVVRVEHLARATGLHVRTLQRMFDAYVGLQPRAVIARLRLHDAVEALDAGTDESIAALAHRLGFFDQAHFTREFTRAVGETPSRYAHSTRS